VLPIAAATSRSVNMACSLPRGAPGGRAPEAVPTQVGP
jgi:hypothetical protein